MKIYKPKLSKINRATNNMTKFKTLNKARKFKIITRIFTIIRRLY